MTSHEHAEFAETIDHPILDLVMRLRARAERDATNLLFLEGVRFIATAEQAGATFRHILTSPTLLTSSAARAAVRRATARGVSHVEMTPEVFRAISQARRASGVAAIVEQRWRPLASLDDDPLPDPREEAPPPAYPLWVAMRHLQSAGNLGTLVRSAHALGARGLICIGETLDPYAPDCVRASMGALIGLECARTTHERLDAWRRASARRWRLVGASAHATHPAWQARLDQPLILLMGHERHGLTKEGRDMCDELVGIPMRTDLVTSLNVGVAGSVLLYEISRQRHWRHLPEVW